jgi:hypothetical protein
VVDASYREKGDIVLQCSDYRCVARELFIWAISAGGAYTT